MSVVTPPIVSWIAPVESASPVNPFVKAERASIFAKGSDAFSSGVIKLFPSYSIAAVECF